MPLLPPYCRCCCRHHASPTSPSCRCRCKAVNATATITVALPRHRHRCRRRALDAAQLLLPSCCRRRHHRAKPVAAALPLPSCRHCRHCHRRLRHCCTLPPTATAAANAVLPPQPTAAATARLLRPPHRHQAATSKVQAAAATTIALSLRRHCRRHPRRCRAERGWGIVLRRERRADRWE